MEKPIRVLMLVSNLRVSNGVASFAMNYYRKLNHDEISMDFVTYNNIESPYIHEIEKSGGKVYTLPPVSRPVSHIKECLRILKTGKYDIIHDNTVLISLPMMGCAARLVKWRVLHSHSAQLGETKKKAKRNALFLPLLIKFSNAFAACSDAAAKTMFGEQEYRFIPNIIDAEKYCFNQEARSQLRLQMGVEDKKIIATVGRLAEVKNPFFALDVFDRLAEREPDAEYWWIGSGPLDQKLAEYAKTLKHGDRVRLLGSRNDVKELYQAIDVFFLPSLFEGMPLTGIESQAMGLPSVISDTVTKEMVYTDLVEFVSLDDPIDTWVAALERQIARIPDRRSYTKELKESVFSADSAGQRLEEYYKCLLIE